MKKLEEDVFTVLENILKMDHDMTPEVTISDVHKVCWQSSTNQFVNLNTKCSCDMEQNGFIFPIIYDTFDFDYLILSFQYL